MAEPRATDLEVPPLIGRLPPQCQRDVDALRRVVRAALARETPAEAVPPNEFREVLLTGATGFVGRFFLRALLQQNERLIVHCLVRAESVAHGLERIREGLEEAELWEDDFAPRLRALPGDVCAEQFGLGDAAFADLSRWIDAVYHLAANVGLVVPYDDIREANALGMRPVLELCLRTRIKHLFHVSSMGVFPAYFCNFAREYSQSRIDDQMSPDVTEMKNIFPLGVVGYPWSKLVAEQGVLFAKSAGVPIAIFRLPLMGLPSTGYTHANDFPTRLFAAATQLEKAPQGFTIQRQSEPVDTVIEICAAISLNPDRRFTVYHCCDPEPPHEDLEVAEFGFYWQEVSYLSFRRSCQAVGEESPLHGQWSLFDQFAPYWFSEDKIRHTLPISDRAVREDCPRPIKWPALLIRHARSYDWLRRNEEKWPHAIPQARLDFEGLAAQAETYARRMGVPFEETYPAWKLEGLKQLIEALKSPDAGLRGTAISHVVYGLTRALRNNATLARERQQHPEIEREEIERPVFVAGINRTGTTFLHRLLSRDPQFWALRRYELTEPVLSTGEYGTVAWTAEDPRRVYAEELLSATGAIDALAGLHRVDMSEPEEDFMLLWLAFRTWAFTIAHYVPEYGRWLAAAGSREVYAHHRYVMQNFTWQRRQREPEGQQHWLLKAPFHLRELEALLEAYPDAVFIQTHREPVEFMASWNSLAERLRGFATEPRPPHETGAEQLAFMSGMLNGAMRFRAANPALEERWVDVRYADLVADPMAVARDIYARLGWPLEKAAAGAMEDWLDLQAEQRRHEPRHEYSLEDYGLTPAAVDAAFAPYRDFVAARGIALSGST
ncbi:MAG: SDR family oxidoreductase [Rhodospirillales bacterium]|nr:SDR family oxidoreductase [Rhodospirillales bacterium]MDE0378015.1 SDR family oxidoreductase [Rhodospirillales bacterium]